MANKSSNSRETANNLILKQVKELNKCISEENVQVINRRVQKSSVSVTSGKCRSKLQGDDTSQPSGWLWPQKSTSVGKDVEKSSHLHSAGGAAPKEDSMEIPAETKDGTNI